MIQHTLILTTPKVEIPSTKILEFTKDLIASNLTNIDYFGLELDNGTDYADDEMQFIINNSTFITFHFKNEMIDYAIVSDEEVFSIISTLLNTNIKTEINIDEKDIEIYII